MNKQVFFDFDGTIADSQRGIIAAVKKMVDELELPHLTDADYRLFIGPTVTDSLKKFYPALSAAQINAGVTAYKENYNSEGLFELDIYPGIKEALINLKSAGYRLNLASAKPEPVLRRIIDKFQLNTYFNGIYGATQNSQLRVQKADILAYGLEQSGATQDQSVMVGDRYTDMNGGFENHVKTLGVTYGFGDASELRAANAMVLVTSPEELPAGVKQLLG